MARRKQIQVRLDRARQVATTWLDADRQKEIEQLEPNIHQVTPTKSKLFDKLFSHHEWQLLQDVRTTAIGPRSIFAKELAQKKAAAEDEADGAPNMTANRWLQFQIHQSEAEIGVTTLSLAETECVTIQLEREIDGTTLRE